MSKRLNIQYEVTIRGIPAGVADVIISGGCLQTEVDPGEPPYVEYIITDRKGYPALWLEEQMTNRDYDKLESELLELTYEEQEPYLD